MAATHYHLHLKGFVGGYDFDSDYVDYILSKHKDDEVKVLIDSFGGQLNTALSISSAFARHGKVHVHFVGMNASAATIASMGAAHISMDASAMYLVHKCSTAFFQWGSLNADGMQTLIEQIAAQKENLDKMDANVATMYAGRCKKDVNDLMALMKKGGWLTATEAHAWGFVDEITSYDEEKGAAPVLTDTVATAMADAGIPIPDVPRQHPSSEESAFTRFMQALATFFKGNAPVAETHTDDHQHTITTMNKKLVHICQILGLAALASEEGNIALTEAQAEQLEKDLEQRTKAQADLETRVTNLQKQVDDLKAENDKLKQQPAVDSPSVITQGNAQTHDEEKSDAEIYCETVSSARDLFNMVP